MLKYIIKKIIIWILRLEARLILKKYKPGVIAVTGSVGKTSTKDAIYTALDDFLLIRKSVKSYNSELGVPLAILGCETGWNNPLLWGRNILEGLALILFKNHYPKWLILEIGADRPGDIEKVSQWLKPDILIITRFGDVPVHVEFFASPEDLVKEKSYLVSALKKKGFLVVNNDDKRSFAMREKFDGMTTTYGLGKGSAMLASKESIVYKDDKPVGVKVRVDHDGSSVPLDLVGVTGKQYVYSALAALSVGVYLKVNVIKMSQALKSFRGSPGRMRLIDGIKGSCIIDDTYNASPVAVEAALETLKDIETKGVKIAVLGDMLELGKYTVEEHKKIGKLAGGVCDLLLVVGLRAKSITEGALLGGLSEKNVIEFEDSQKAGKYLEHILKEGDVVLVKGSQSMRMEHAVEEIMAHPEHKAELLVRQEKEWMER